MITKNAATYSLAKPDPNRDAPFAFGWFTSPDGRETLLRMGNTVESITEPTFEGEYETLASFIDLEKAGEQITWMIRADEKTIGAVWIDLHPSEYLQSPSVHIMIGDTDFRGKGIGKSVMQEMIDYARDALKVDTLYSRHLQSNVVIDAVLKSLGYIDDGEPYTDKDELGWQNMKINL